MLVLAIVTLLLHNLIRLHVSQSFHCVKPDIVHKTRFRSKERVLAHLTSFFQKKTRLNARKCLFLQ